MATRSQEELALFHQAREALAGFSYSKCWRLVDAHLARHAPDAEFGAWIKRRVSRGEHIGQADPTGEDAVDNVMRNTNKR